MFYRTSVSGLDLDSGYFRKFLQFDLVKEMDMNDRTSLSLDVNEAIIWKLQKKM